jgi:esterase/lipase
MIFKKAILIIHGFAGGTYDQEELAFNLELNKSFDVFQFTLPGHDKNLSKVNYQEWIKSSEEKIELLIN